MIQENQNTFPNTPIFFLLSVLESKNPVPYKILLFH